MDRIVVINAAASLVTDADAQKWCDAIQRQIAGDFAPLWGVSAIVHFIGAGSQEQPSAEDGVLHLVPTSTQPGTLGSHWLAGGRPIGEIGVETCNEEGVAPSSCLSHEALEMLLDPLATLSYQVGGLFLAAEVCDRVEASDPSYTIDGVSLENFSTERAFIEGASEPYDFRGKSPDNKILPNGYQLQVDIGNGQWTQITGARARASKCVAGEQSRRAQRMRRAGFDPTKLVLVRA